MALSANNKMLVDAAAEGDNTKVEEALRLGADIHADADLALEKAVRYARNETVALLLDRGANINVHGGFPLCVAVICGYTKTTALLLGRDADIHAGDDAPLCAAAKSGRTKAVELLLDLGANIHAGDDAPLCAAASKGHTKIVALLLERGADIHAGNDVALCRATTQNHKETAILLLRHGAYPKRTSKKFIPPRMVEWLRQLKQEASAHFTSGKPTREQCFSPDETGIRLNDRVLDACVTDQFTTLIGAPLIASTDKADRQLFKDVWDALPGYWQDQNQNIYMQFVKEGGLNPVVGTHTGAVQHDFLPSLRRVGR